MYAEALSLKQRVLKAGLWTLGGYGSSQIIRFASNLLMTRLLVPEMFGVMAIAMLVIVGLAMITDVGLKQSVIQSRRGADPLFLNTAWGIQILRGAALSVFTLVAALALLLANKAAWISNESVYSDPLLPCVISVLSAVTTIGGFQSTKVFEAGRNLSLSRVTTIELIAQIFGIVCMLIWASFDRSIWCLLGGQICSLVAVTMMSHTCLPGVSNRLQWDQSAAREIVHFGKWIMASSVLGFLANNGDRLLLGALVPPATLGVYIIAFSIVSSIDQIVTKVAGDLAFPALSEIARRQGANQLKPSYYRFFVILASLCYMSTGILTIAGQSIINLLYDSRYGAGGWMLQVLAIAIVTMPFRLASMCLLALGLPRDFFMLIVVRVIFLFCLTPLGFHFWGFPGALAVIVASFFSTIPLTIYYSLRHGFFDLRKEFLLLGILAFGILIGELIKLVI